MDNQGKSTGGKSTGKDETSSPNLNDVAAAAAQGAAQGAASAPHIGVTEDQMRTIVANVMAAASSAAQSTAQATAEATATRIAAEMAARQQKASGWKQHATTAGISTAVFALGTAAVAGYNRYRNRDDGDHRGRGNQG